MEQGGTGAELAELSYRTLCQASGPVLGLLDSVLDKVPLKNQVAPLESYFPSPGERNKRGAPSSCLVTLRILTVIFGTVAALCIGSSGLSSKPPLHHRALS